MIFLFSVIVRSHCNESEIPDGYVCCKNVVCATKYCFNTSYETVTNEVRKTHVIEKCLDEKQYFFCMTFYGTLSFIGVCIAPTIIAAFFQICFSYRIPKATIVFNLLSNIALGFLLSFIPCTDILALWRIFIIAFSGALLFILFILEFLNACNKCESYTTYNGKYTYKSEACFIADSLVVHEELRLKKVTIEELNNIILENTAIPPELYATAVSYSSDSIDSTQSSITEHSKSIPITYGSWEETNKLLPNIKNKKAVIYKLNRTYDYKDNMKKNIQNTYDQAQEQVERIYGYTPSYVSTTYQAQGQVDGAIGYDRSCIVDCCTSCFIRNFIYQLMMFFGYNGIIDAIWRSNIKFVTHESHRIISLDESLRAKAGQRDEFAYNNNYAYDQDSSCDQGDMKLKTLL